MSPRTLRYHARTGARPLAAARVIVVGLVAFSLAGLLNADSLYAQASRQPYGWKRTVARGAMGPVRRLSHATHLNRPRILIEDAIGRDDGPGRTGGPTPDGRSRVTVTTRPPEAPPPTIAPRLPTQENPLRLWVGGDSMAQVFGESVVDKAGSRGTITPTLDYRISTGLTRPDYFDWPAHLRDDVLPTDPEVIIIMFGANDAQPMEVDGTPYKVRTPEWQQEYRARVALTMDLLAGDGRLVIWVGQPRMRDGDFDERMGILDEIYQGEAASRPWVRFLDSRVVLAPEGGGFAAYLPGEDGQPNLARQGDGIHLTRYGGDRLADATLAVIDLELAAGATTPKPTSTSGG
ncbi:MAG: DUF459 domain-containing protein [Acidimicrobiales bacterium]